MSSGIKKFKRQEYTGENRCEPCTILNLIIAGMVGTTVARKSRLGAVIAVGLSIVLIYLRGYLIPGTPTLTKRYLPQEVLQWFGKETLVETANGFGIPNESLAEPTESPNETASRNTEPEEPEDIGLDLESYFLEYSVLKLCENQTDLCLTPEFQSQWNRTTNAVETEHTSTEDIIETYKLNSEDEYDIETIDNSHILRRDGSVIGQWPSKAALIADKAAAMVLAEQDPIWSERSPEQKGEILDGLRLFLETCPNGESAELTQKVVDSCCSSQRIIAVVCEESGERLFEQPIN